MFLTLPKTLKYCQSERRLLENEPMQRHTSLKTGGCADILVCPANEEELQSILSEAHAEGVPVQIIGKGSNLVVKDGGIRGLVIKIDKAFSGIDIEDARITCLAGTSMANLAAAAAQAGLSGLEFAQGIPGTVGGGIFMNAGAYGSEMKDVVKTVFGLDSSGKSFEYSNADMAFSYRFSRAEADGLIITKAIFELTPGDKERITAKMNDFALRRREKQPLSALSCGSTFKRPEGHYAGALIEECGLKGVKVGLSQVSEKHAGFLINHPGGTAKDFLALIALVQKTVYDKKGIMLETEVRILGEDTPIKLI